MNLVDLGQEEMDCDVQEDSAVESDEGEIREDFRRIVFTGAPIPESNIHKSCSRETKSEAKYLSMAKRVGFISKSRLSSQSGDIRLNWNKKLNKPRLGMVADLEEEARGKKTSILTIVPNSPSEEIYPRRKVREYDEPLIRVVTQDVSSFSQDDEEEPSRTFHFVSENEIEPFNNIPLEEDCGQGLEMDNSNIIIKISQDNTEAHNNNTEMFDAEDNDDGKDDVPAEQADTEEMTVLDKIAAIKEIDRKLLTIERERSRALRRRLEKTGGSESPERVGRRGREVVRSRLGAVRRRKRRRRSSSTSSSSSSSSSQSSSDSSSESEGGQTQSRPAGKLIEKDGEKDERDLKEKLKHYLSRARAKQQKRKK